MATDAEPFLKIGVVGFSRNQFDKADAKAKLAAILDTLIAGRDRRRMEIVSGYTNMGIPKIAYQLADGLGIDTIGFSARQALKVRSGLYPVTRKIIVGERFGDESEKFVRYVDVLVRIGGGPQSRREVELFRDHQGGADLSAILFEEEVDWFGR